MLFLNEDKRAIRALFALLGVLALGILFAVLVVADGDEDAELVRRINMMLWGVSELNYSSQKLAAALIEESYDPAMRDATRLAFDVAWSRLDIVRREDVALMQGGADVLSAFDQFFEEADGILYANLPPPSAQLRALAADVTEITRETRQVWLRSFNALQTPEKIRAILSVDPQGSLRLKIVVAALVMFLLAYLFVEIRLSSIAQRREARLRHAAAEASAAKSRFIAAVSHEVRTPLNGILATADLLAETSLSDDQRHLAGVIQGSGAKLLDMLNDVLDFSKLEAGQFAVQQAPFYLSDVLDEVQGLYAPAAARKSLRLSVWNDEANELRLLGDGRRLQQVLNNLVSNAIKFTESGSVSVTARFLHNANAGAPAGLTICVEDTGCGIAKDDMLTVFAPFGQSSTGLDRSHEGTGLGLSISRDLSEAMGGKLTLRSTEGVGSVFELFLPLQLAQRAEEPEATGLLATEPDLSEDSILIVDDNATNRFILKRLIRSLGGDAREARSGHEALAYAASSMPSLVLMDVQMPGMDGVTATEQLLHQACELKATPPYIIGVTANAQPDQVQGYLAKGMHDVVAKPIRKSELCAALQMRLQNSDRSCA